MKFQSNSLRKIIVFLCVALILAYACLVFLPHFHDCRDADCCVCSLIDLSRDILLCLMLSAAICQTANFSSYIIDVCSHALSVCDGTLVGLKVKLSD